MAKKDKPRICIAGYHSCIRAYKFALALLEKGYEVYWLCNYRMPGHVSFHIFNGINVYQLGELGEVPNSKNVYYSFKRQVEMLAKVVDVFHWYNEPDWGVAQIKAVTDKPVLYDIHDLRSDREFIERDDENDAFKLADAILTQSPDYDEIARKKRPDLDKDGLIGHCLPAVNRSLYPALDEYRVALGTKALGGIVYEGGVATGIGGGNELQFRWWLPFMQKICQDHILMSLHPSSNADYSLYRQAGVRVCEMMPYKEMLANLPMYDWGLVGNAVRHPAFDKAMPNKLFEYMAAGLPVIVHDAKQVSEFVKDEGIGVTVDRAEDVKKVFPHALKYRENVMKARQHYCMDVEVKKLEKLYERMLESNGK